MALTEEQIVRYSRQILVREVGGVGQERLLGATATVREGSVALQVAAAYLAAGGTSVVSGGTSSLSIIGPGDEVPGGAVVIVGADRIIFGSARTCRACLGTVAGGEPSADEAQLLGALAALVVQRFVLSGDDEGAVQLAQEGGFTRKPLPRCLRCA